jgi:DNA excision repair protein ERCC-6
MAKMSHQNLRRPGFQEDISLDYEESSEEEDEIPKKRRRLEIARVNATESEDFESISQNTSRKLKIREASSHSEDDYYSPGHPKKVKKHHRKRLDKDEDNFTVTGGVSEDRTDDDDDDDDDDDGDGDYIVEEEAATMKLRKRKAKSVEVDDLQKLDDGDEKYYQKRLKKWSISRRTARNRENKSNGGTAKGLNPNPQLEEWYMPHPNKADAVFSGGFKIPGDIFPSLFDYQKIGVQWLWELHAQDAGGIIGDEMGLGKTIQIISFIAGLHHSNMLRKPVLIVAPATVLKQWANEFHLWWPPLRVSILHSSGSGMLNVKQEEDSDELLEEEKSFSGRKSQVGARKIVSKVFDKGLFFLAIYHP